MAKAKKSAIDNTPLSLAEFKAWLAGVSDMQPATWSPDKQQWDKIRSQIDRIQETKHHEPPSQITQEQQYGNIIPHQTGFIAPASALSNIVPTPFPSVQIGNGVAGVPVDVNNPPPPGTEFI